MNSSTTVVIIGAGPYGLSLAAHLADRGVPHRIFGPPMHVWRSQMPVGMHLKSDGFASDLYDPQRRFTLKKYCEERQIEYADYGIPVSVDTFVAYALEFQKRFVPHLDSQFVVNVTRQAQEYAIRLENGELVSAKAVVVATGISYFPRVPAPLDSLPAGLCAHSSAHHELSGFRNRRVVVVGGGASGTDLAALLSQAGSSVTLISRRPLKFHLPPNGTHRTWWQRLRAPNLGLGPGLKSAAYTAFPGGFRLLPQAWRLGIVRHHLGPTGGWFVKDQIVGKVSTYAGARIESATAVDGRAVLRVAITGENTITIEADYVIAATGYEASTDRLQILDSQIRSDIRREADAPWLSGSFESSIPGLYFIGVAAANCFGPLMRFALGAEYSAKRLGAHLHTVYESHKTAEDPQAATA